MTSVDQVIEAWADIAPRLDPIEGNSEAMELLRDPAQHHGPIASALGHMQLVDETEGRLLEEMDYGFCLEPRLWRRGGEAVLQARALQQVLFWAARFPADRDALKRIVVRHTFDPSFNFATPLYVSHAGIHFVVVPQVYQEVLHLPAAALWEAYAAPSVESPWGLLDDPHAAVARSTEAPLSFRRFVARLVTSVAADPNLSGENPVSHLSRASSWFAGIDDARVPSELEATLAYAGQDFALAHEIGHCLTGGAQPDRPEMEVELAADGAGFQLYAASWGWRDELLEGCPLTSGARTLLGPIWFFRTAAILFDTRRRLSERIASSIRCDMGFINAGEDRAHLEALTRRWHQIQQRLAFYGEQVQRLAGGFSAQDVSRLAALLSVLDSMEERLDAWLDQMPASELLNAVRLVRPDAEPM